MTSFLQFHSLCSAALAIILCFIWISKLCIIEANYTGFSVDLIPRDSPKSPFYNPALTHSQRVVKSLQRSFSRANYFRSPSPSHDFAMTKIVPYDGEFLIKISISNPPFEILAIADTGSNLVWTQCKPCQDCYKQKAPLFDPSISSTYQDVACDSKSCKALSGTCEKNTSACIYFIVYGDWSLSQGHLATEVVTVESTAGKQISFPNTIFGCSHSSGGEFSDNGSGIIGLGAGEYSLISQMEPTIGGKFSYCLAPAYSQSANASRMNFGNYGIVSGPGVVSTPIVPGPENTLYYLVLVGISVGNQRLSFNSSSSAKINNETKIIIDCGSTLSSIPPYLYSELELAVKKTVHAQPVKDPQGLLSLCYSNLVEANIPIVTMHFKGADVKLNPLNIFVSTSPRSVCLAFASDPDIYVYGYSAQMNFLVGYDLQKKTVSFKPTDCTRQ